MAIMIGIVYFIVKMVENRVLHQINADNTDDKMKPAKVLMGDSILVSISVLIGYLLIDQSSPFTLTNSSPMEYFLRASSPNTLDLGIADESRSPSPMVFTDTPDF